jgi:asparagine synthase (glutamine-hydrolysing)
VARQAGTLHRELTAGTQDAIDYLPRLVWHMEEPMGDSSIIPNFLISRFSASHVKVCLSGLGGDELFGGYSRYSDPSMGRIRSIFRYAPVAARLMAPRVTAWHYPWGEELRLAGDASQAWRGYLHRIQIFNPSALRKLGMTATGRAEQVFESLWNRFPGTDAVSRRQFVDQHTYLPDTILALTDRMSMANSLEVRVPFMDYRLVRLSQRFGSLLKQHSGDFKILLKRALGDRCPTELLNRPKWGFDTPLSRWVSQPEMMQILQALPQGLAVRESLIRPAAVRALVESPAAIFANARRLWNLLILDVWLSVKGHLSAPSASLRDLILVHV